MDPKPTAISRIAGSMLESAGWTTRISIPDDLDRCVVIGAPHTSNWDFILTLLVGAQIELDFAWVGKHTLFRPPYGAVMRALGGIPVDRDSRQNAVSQLADAIRAADQLALVIAPEGTRSRGEYWKSGFYYIAREAEVPLVLGYVDYQDREAGLGAVIDPVGPVDEVMETLRAFYAGKVGLYPDQFTEPKLRSDGTV